MVGTALTAYTARFAKDAQAQAATFAKSGRALSTRGGTFSLAGETLGPKVAVVIVDAAFENTYYEGAFDPDGHSSPICYAIARDKHALSPHETMQADLGYFKPQHFPCQGCPQNEFGSAAVGKGKACKNKVRLTVIPAGYYTAARGRAPLELHLFEDAAHYAKADAVGLAVPALSVEAWSKYVSQLAAAHQRPSYAVVTEITIVPHPKFQFTLAFDMLELIGDDLFEPIVGRVEAQLATPFVGYPPPSVEEAKPSAPPRGGVARRF